MTTTVDQWNRAFSILEKFERQILPPSDFGWNFIVKSSGVSKATLWRNKEFETEFQRVRALVKGYSLGESEFDLEGSIASARNREKDRQIEKLKSRVDELTKQLNRERERLVYAAVIARRRNIDPAEFMDHSPLMRSKNSRAKITAITKKAGRSSTDL